MGKLIKSRISNNSIIVVLPVAVKIHQLSVKNAPWKNGKGDVIRELADARKEYGLKLGTYQE